MRASNRGHTNDLRTPFLRSQSTPQRLCLHHSVRGMLEAEEDEGPPPPPIGAPSPPPASPPPAESPAVAVSHLIDRATTLIRQNSPFGTPVRGSPLSTPTASLSALHASPSPSPSYPSLPAAAFTPSSPRRPTPGTRSLTVSTPNDVYNIQFSPDLDSLAIDACSLSSLPLQVRRLI